MDGDCKLSTAYSTAQEIVERVIFNAVQTMKEQGLTSRINCVRNYLTTANEANETETAHSYSVSATIVCEIAPVDSDAQGDIISCPSNQLVTLGKKENESNEQISHHCPSSAQSAKVSHTDSIATNDRTNTSKQFKASEQKCKLTSDLDAGLADEHFRSKSNCAGSRNGSNAFKSGPVSGDQALERNTDGLDSSEPLFGNHQCSQPTQPADGIEQISVGEIYEDKCTDDTREYNSLQDNVDDDSRDLERFLMDEAEKAFLSDSYAVTHYGKEQGDQDGSSLLVVDSNIEEKKVRKPTQISTGERHILMYYTVSCIIV